MAFLPEMARIKSSPTCFFDEGSCSRKNLQRAILSFSFAAFSAYLAHEIDARELPPGWKTGYLPWEKRVPYEQHRVNLDIGESKRLRPAAIRPHGRREFERQFTRLSAGSRGGLRVGHAVVAELVQNWCRYRDTAPGGKQGR
jgi:hypothetical protein